MPAAPSTRMVSTCLQDPAGIEYVLVESSYVLGLE
jgi:hypothetical protein